MIIKTTCGVFLIGTMFFILTQSEVENERTIQSRNSRNSECVIFPDDSEKIPEGLVPCVITNYISGWTEYENCARSEVVKSGATVMMAAMNKILGKRGDVDKNGECEPKDAWEFSRCMTGGDQTLGTCLCLFDYDQDDDLDLADFQHLQNAVGTGNKTWRKEHYPLNCCRSWD